MVAKGKLESTQVSGGNGMPRFVHHPDFAEPAITAEYLVNIDNLLEADAPPAGRDEIRLFQAMHYCAFKARRAQRRGASGRSTMQNWLRRHESIREHLIRVNLGLSYDMLRRTTFDNVDKDDLLGEGLRALCDAVDAYDPWRGFRFSTYACNAIYRGFLRLAKSETRRARFVSFGFEPRMERGVTSNSPWGWDERVYSERLKHILDMNTADLTGAEQYVLSRRFPERSDVKRATLECLGREMNVSKEHVRQVQLAALEKLRDKLVSQPVLC